MLDEILVKDPSRELAIDIIDSEDELRFAPVAEYICAQHGIELTSYRKINGWANVILEINHQYIIKVSAPNWAILQRREIEALALLSDHHLPTPVPKLLHQGEYNGWVYFVSDKLSGTNLHDVWPTLGFDDKQRIMHQVGCFAKALNALDVEPKGLLHVDWQAFLQSHSADAYERRKKQNLSGPLLDDINPYLNEVNYQPKEDKPMLIHCDLHAGNLLGEQIDGQWHLSGVIDFGDAVISTDKHYEMTSTTILMGLGDSALNRAFFDGYGLTIDDVERLQQILMVLSIIRHSGELQYVLNQVKGCADMPNWHAVAERFFAL